MKTWEFVTTFWDDFTIADKFGEYGIRDTFNRAFKTRKDDKIYFTEFVIVLNWKIREHYDNWNEEIARIYDELRKKANWYVMDNWKWEKLDYFLSETD